LQLARKNPATLKSADLGFSLAPRINAAGRLDTMSLGIACLLSDDTADALSMAEALNDLNEDRKQIEGSMKTEALALLPALGPDRIREPVVCLFDERWHQGVVGIIASRLKEKYHLPSVVFALDDNNTDYLKGSARSIRGLHMRDLLDRVASQHPGLIVKFGGHAMAAGMTISKNNFEKFRSCLNEEVLDFLEETSQQDILQAQLQVDGELASNLFSLDFAEQLHALGPWGQRFPEPMFIGDFEIVRQRLLADRHLKLYLKTAGADYAVDAIAFNVDTKIWPSEQQQLKAVYKLDINEFRDKRQIQLLIEHIF
jgi:single-stranded-DNA-specific exonuclease